MEKTNPLYQYQTNLFTQMADLSLKAKQISQELEKLQFTITEFEKSIYKTLEQFPENDLSNSFVSLLKKNLDIQTVAKTHLSCVTTSYKSFSEKLKGRWDWTEVMSETDKLKKQQMKEIFNIHSYRCFAKLLNDMSKLFDISINKEVLQDFNKTSEQLMNDRVKSLEMNYNTPLTYILQHEERGMNTLPIAFEKMMYKLYYDPSDIEGAFRQNGGVTEMIEYMNLIGVVDVELMDYILISALIKKFLRETSEPIWPNELYDKLISITSNYNSNSNKWKSKFLKLYETIPQQNKVFIEHLIALCLKIVNNPTSKMTFQNMSICIAPSFIRKVEESSQQTTHQACFSSFMNMLQNADELFPNINSLFQVNKYQNIVDPPTLYKETFHEKKFKYNTSNNTSVNRHKRRAVSYMPLKTTGILSIKDLC